jgi:hypothetical protein
VRLHERLVESRRVDAAGRFLCVELRVEMNEPGGTVTEGHEHMWEGEGGGGLRPNEKLEHNGENHGVCASGSKRLSRERHARVGRRSKCIVLAVLNLATA